MARDTAMEHLHPIFRDPARALIEMLAAEQLPFRLFEGFRTPHSQRDLYAQGRTRPGKIVTKAAPWSSHHQYGFAGDFVLHVDGQWSWDDSGDRKQWWTRLHELARRVDLEPLSWELPHVQLNGLNIGELRAGRYPPGGDATWGDNLESAIHSWQGIPAAPPAPITSPERPALDSGAFDQADDRATLGRPAQGAQMFRVISRRGLRLRAGPGPTFDIVDTLHNGQVVAVIAVSGEWHQVDLEGDGLADGYCHSGFLVPVT